MAWAEGGGHLNQVDMEEGWNKFCGVKPDVFGPFPVTPHPLHLPKLVKAISQGKVLLGVPSQHRMRWNGSNSPSGPMFTLGWTDQLIGLCPVPSTTWLLCSPLSPFSPTFSMPAFLDFINDCMIVRASLVPLTIWFVQTGHQTDSVGLKHGRNTKNTL